MLHENSHHFLLFHFCGIVAHRVNLLCCTFFSPPATFTQSVLTHMTERMQRVSPQYNMKWTIFCESSSSTFSVRVCTRLFAEGESLWKWACCCCCWNVLMFLTRASPADQHLCFFSCHCYAKWVLLWASDGRERLPSDAGNTLTKKKNKKRKNKQNKMHHVLKILNVETESSSVDNHDDDYSVVAYVISGKIKQVCGFVKGSL